MVYGAGYASADDVVAHELTHAVTQYTANLFYYGQSGRRLAGGGIHIHPPRVGRDLEMRFEGTAEIRCAVETARFGDLVERERGIDQQSRRLLHAQPVEGRFRASPELSVEMAAQMAGRNVDVGGDIAE